MSLRGRLERLEVRAKPPEPPPSFASERRERAFERLFRTLEELGGLEDKEGRIPWADPRVREVIRRHQRETRQDLEKGVEPNG